MRKSDQLTKAKDRNEVSDPVRQMRVDLAAAFRCAARMRWQEGIGGHFSVRLPGQDELFLLNPMGLLWSEIKASDLLVVDFDGSKIEGAGKVERTAFCIHSQIHRFCGGSAHCVMHTHSPFATAMSALKDPTFEPIHQGGLRFYGEVAYDNEFNGPVTDIAEGRRIASTMGVKRVIVLANHGIVITGATIAETFHSAYLFELNCKYIAIARAHQVPLRKIRDEVARSTQPIYEDHPLSIEPQLYFQALRRRLDREEPEYMD